MKPFNCRILPTICLILAMFLWGSSFIALKLAFRTYHPMVVIFGRMAVACFFGLFFIRTYYRRGYIKGDYKYLIFMSFCEPCLYFIFEAKALENTTASQAGMITAILPLMVAVAARLFLKETLTRKTSIGFFISIIGVCWLSVGGESSPNAPNPLLGNFLEFFAMVCAVGYVITLKKLSSRYHPFFLTMVQAFVGSLFFMPFFFINLTAVPLALNPVSLGSIVYLGLFITLGAYGLYNYGLSRIPASQATAFINLIPIFALILGWMVLEETFTISQYCASAVVFIGILISQYSFDQSRGTIAPASEVS